MPGLPLGLAPLPEELAAESSPPEVGVEAHSEPPLASQPIASEAPVPPLDQVIPTQEPAIHEVPRQVQLVAQDQIAPRPSGTTGNAVETATWNSPWSPLRWPGLESAFQEMEGFVREYQSIFKATVGHDSDIDSAEAMCARLKDGPYADLATEISESIFYVRSLRIQASIASATGDNATELRKRARELEIKLVENLRNRMADLGEVQDHTVAGQTFLIDWEVFVVNKDRLEMKRMAALVIAPPGTFLQPHQSLILMHAQDRTSDDPDLVCYQVEARPMRLNETQRTRWGAPASLAGRVFWVWQAAPELAEEPASEASEMPRPKRGRPLKKGPPAD